MIGRMHPERTVRIDLGCGARTLAGFVGIDRFPLPGVQVLADMDRLPLLANPYHKQAFNEHTPRFWTHVPASDIDPREQEPPLGSSWGLSRSDSSDPGLDLRCMRMEFFYFSEYWGLPAERLRKSRRKFLNVCEQIMYHLAVCKPPLTEDALNRAGIDYFTPPQLNERRQAAAQAPSRWARWLRRF